MKATVMRRIEKRLQGIEAQLARIADLLELKPHKCEKCNGKGARRVGRYYGEYGIRCDECDGTGVVWKRVQHPTRGK